jgi:hypothetical protein
MAVLVLVYMYTSANALGPICLIQCLSDVCVVQNASDCTDGQIYVPRSSLYCACCGKCVNNTTG